MRKVVLSVSGSVSAYRACDLARDLMRTGAEVHTCLTRSASKFVSPDLFQVLTGHPTVVDTFDEPVPGRMAHIDWAREADLVIIAPATANTINSVANGLSNNMLTTIALATTKPMLIAPAMNPAMYQNETLQKNLRSLIAKGHAVVEPSEGDVACGEHGQGKLASNQSILESALLLLNRSQKLEGKTVLITTGSTQEAIDDVRFVSNRSSGKMGQALAVAAHWMGAKVIIVSGPTALPEPTFAESYRVRSALEMHETALRMAKRADIIVGAAAVADYRPVKKVEGKLRRSSENLTLEFAPNPDIIAALAKENPGAVTVAFAAEPTTDLAVAKDKMIRKGVYAIAANDVSRSDIGFESDTNELTLLKIDGSVVSSGLQSKIGCALWLLEHIV